MLPTVTATRYVTPLREGGSLPGLMEADDLGTYVVKFRGAGQGPKALAAEVISARLARACGLLVPDLVAVDLDPGLAAGEPDQEIQDLLRASGGLNLGVDFLAGAVDFDAAAATVDGGLAGRIVWFDALVSNADRSWRNPNMLFWRGLLYLIDHGATLTYQHRWSTAAAAAARHYDIADHALIGCRRQSRTRTTTWRRRSPPRCCAMPSLPFPVNGSCPSRVWTGQSRSARRMSGS